MRYTSREEVTQLVLTEKWFGVRFWAIKKKNSSGHPVSNTAHQVKYLFNDSNGSLPQMQKRARFFT
jgi:hypothetical protein